MPRFRLNVERALAEVPENQRAGAKIQCVRTRFVGPPGEPSGIHEHAVDEDGCCDIVTDDPREIRQLRVDPRFDEVADDHDRAHHG